MKKYDYATVNNHQNFVPEPSIYGQPRPSEKMGIRDITSLTNEDFQDQTLELGLTSSHSYFSQILNVNEYIGCPSHSFTSNSGIFETDKTVNNDRPIPTSVFLNLDETSQENNLSLNDDDSATSKIHLFTEENSLGPSFQLIDKRSERIKNYKSCSATDIKVFPATKKSFSCKECKAKLSSSSSLKIHHLLHTGERPYQCSKCDKSFLKKSNLSIHERNHSGEKPHICSECGKSFRLLSTLKSHILTHTGEQPFECSICNSSFSQRASLTRHKMTHTDFKPYVCEKCGGSFQNKNYFKKHLLTHVLKAQHACSICGEGFKNTKKLRIHLRVHNEGLKPFQCSKCYSEFASLKPFRQHMRRVHGSNKEELRCEECDAQFKSIVYLKSHKKVHIGTNAIACDICKASFNHSGTHIKHMRRHEKQAIINKEKSNIYNDPAMKPSDNASFSCSVCLKVYKSKRQLQAHKCNLLEDSNYESISSQIDSNS